MVFFSYSRAAFSQGVARRIYASSLLTPEYTASMRFTQEMTASPSPDSRASR